MVVGQTCSLVIVKGLETYFGARNRLPDLDEITTNVICPLAEGIGKLVICIDGVEDAPEAEFDEIWRGIRKIMDFRNSKSDITKVLISGESGSKVSQLLPLSTPRIDLNVHHVSQDIETYVEARLQERSGKGQLFFDADLRGRVKNSLLREADRMCV